MNAIVLQTARPHQPRKPAPIEDGFVPIAGHIRAARLERTVQVAEIVANAAVGLVNAVRWVSGRR